MDAPILVTPPAVILPEPLTSQTPLPDFGDLLRQLIDVQKEQLAFQKTQAAAQDGGARWRAFLNRWQSDFPDIGQACRLVLPTVERAYLSLMKELTDRLKDEPADELENEYVLAEFLDRYGMRLGQLGTVLSQLGPLADAAPPASAPADAQ